MVVGAGPVGLTAALALRARGLPVTVLETGDADRVRPGSRAIFLHSASLALLEEIRPGLGHALAAHGLVLLTRADAVPRPRGLREDLPAAAGRRACRRRRTCRRS